MQSLPGIVQGIRDPLGTILQLLTGVLSHFIATARTDLNSELSRYLFTTVDPTGSGIRPLTANPAISHLNGALALVADVLVGAVLVYASLRSIFEHSIHARYALHLVIPRVMASLVMVHGSAYFIQMAVDLNNAIGGIVQSLGGPLTMNTLPWSGSMSAATVSIIQGSQDLFHAVFALGVVVAVVILVLSYVIRIAMLDILVVLAPLAALCSVLPDTRRYAYTWLRLFMVAVFMQAVQLIILRVATAVGFGAGSGIAESLFALAILWIVLKVPGTLHAATHVETNAHTAMRHVRRSMHKALVPAHHVVRHRTAL
ncbi:MAG TPA: conjugal transfer protein TrbL family protein [Candidatus Saccharimonadales bacterium]|nr:conjugal transfer protein TrbL family protein [Candidatus Saccharimonadales bacterium]